MALDLDAIRKKLAQVSGQNSRKNALWKPAEGKEHTVRIIPYLDNDGQPFKERWFYYNLGKGGTLSLKQFGQKDPVEELIQKLREDGTKESYEMVKPLYPKVRHYAPVIVKGEEDKGARLWAFGKDVCEALLRKFLDEDYGDITDVLEGNDIKITAKKLPTQSWFTTTVDVRPKKSALTHDAAQLKAWQTAIPKLEDLYTTKTYEELEKLLSDFLSGSPAADDTGTDKGTEAAAPPKPTVEFSSDPTEAEQQIDDIFAELKNE